MPRLEDSIDIRGTMQAVYQIASDMENYPKYMEDVEGIRVLTEEEITNLLADLTDTACRDEVLAIRAGPHRTTVTYWETYPEGTPIEWYEVDIFLEDPDQPRIVYKLVKGDLHKFEGEWCFKQINPETVRVTLVIDYDFNIPSLQEMIGPTLDIKLRENAQMMLQGQRSAVEALAV
jgi:ribosome-associated toxin RatA of RatAB toxin-antitoxin module